MKPLTPDLVLAEATALAAILDDRTGGGLVMAALYGSAARGDFDSEQSDANLLLVLADPGPDTLDRVAGLLQEARLRFRCAPFVVGREEIRSSLDVFAVKYSEIRRSYRLLRGEDLLAGLSPDPAHVRLECERELRNLTLKLRRAYLAFRPNAPALVGALHRFLPQFLSILRFWADHRASAREGEDLVAAVARHYGVPEVGFREAAALRHRPEAPWPEVEKAFRLVLDLLDRVTRDVDAHPCP